MNTTAPVIALDHPAALDVARVGRKAVNLAAARATGLPVAPGVVLTTEWATDDRATAAQVWRITSHDGARPLVVRPSAAGRDRRRPDEVSAAEEATIVRDLESMLAAVAALRADDPTTPVLLQPHIPGSWHGALFADDRSGWRATPLVAARAAGSDHDWIAEVDRLGHVLDVLSDQSLGGPPAEVLVRLSRLAERVAATFDGPHDVEWVAADDGRVQLMRVRPVVRLRATPSTGSTQLCATIRSHRSPRRRSVRHEPTLVSSRSVDDSAA